MADEQTQLEARRKLKEDSKPDVDQDAIQKEKRDADRLVRQLDGWNPRDRYSSTIMMWGDDAAFPWKINPMPSADRYWVRLLFLCLALIVGAFVLVLVLGRILY